MACTLVAACSQMQTERHSSNLPVQQGQVWRRAIILIVLCVLLAFLATSDLLHSALMSFLDATQSLIFRNSALGAVLFVVFSAVSAMFAFVSVAILVPVAVYTWGEPLSILLLWSGWLLGGVLAYLISRLLGRTVVRWLTASAGMQRLEHLIQRDTPFALVLLFQLALPSEIPGYVLGLVRYNPARYLLSLALAELPYALATVHLGASFVERQGTIVLIMGLLLVLFSVVAFYVLRNQLAARNRDQRL